MDHEQELLHIYQENPYRTLPNAYWKTAVRMDALRLSIRRDEGDQLTAVAVWQGERLMAFWCANPEVHPLSPWQIASVPFALVHANALPVFSQRDFSRREPFFRIIHKDEPPVYNYPPGFEYADVRPESEAREIAELIQTCYKHVQVDETIIKSWLARPVFNPDLWVWIRDQATGEPVGLGIAELDREVPEVSLEWIQVLPSYQGRGLGKAIVAELLRRVSGKAAFTTASGEVDNITKPEKLYRRCGFTGSDVWWLLTA
jgi:GNAT superfamily N-acetyltransferase